MSKSEVAPAKQGQEAFNAVGAHELSATQKKTKLVAKSTPGAALVATGGEQNAKKPSVAKSELEKLGSKKKAATKSRKPAKTGAVSDPKRAVIGDFVKVAAERKIKHALDQDKSLSGGALGVSDPKFTTSTTIGPVARVDGGQAVARAVAVQISQAVANGANKMVEISLDPVELGKVKMKLRPSDSGITVQIIADRADTIDLMRRNTAMLEAEFRDVGYDNINFTFAQNNNGSHAHADDDPPPIESLGEGRSAATGSSVTSPVSSARTITRLGLGDGLDIRL